MFIRALGYLETNIKERRGGFKVSNPEQPILVMGDKDIQKVEQRLKELTDMDDEDESLADYEEGINFDDN